MCQIMLQMLSQMYRFLFNTSPKSNEKISAGEMGDQISIMEGKISQLEEQNKELQRKLEYNQNKEAALQKVLCNYDNLLKKVLIEKKTNTQKDETTMHLVNLESAFYDLLQKYEKAKFVVQGYQENESILRKKVEEYEEIIENLRTKFAIYKTHSGNEIKKKSPKTFLESKDKRRRLVTTI